MTDPTTTPPLPGDGEVPAWAETGAGYGGRVPRVRPDLPTWLREQIAEDRRVAEVAARKEGGADWYYDADIAESVRVENGSANPAIVNGPYGYLGEAGEHIARWDPARVLAECDAKERIVESFTSAAEWSKHPDCPQPDAYARVAGGVLDILRMLALPYSARPGYQEEWKP